MSHLSSGWYPIVKLVTSYGSSRYCACVITRRFTSLAHVDSILALPNWPALFTLAPWRRWTRVIYAGAAIRFSFLSFLLSSTAALAIT